MSPPISHTVTAPTPTYYAPPPIASWTGFYVGLNAGGTFGGSDNIHVSTGVFGPGVDAAALGVVGSGVGNSNYGGFIGGGQIGYNYQFSPAIVAGLEADFQGLAGGGGTSSFSLASHGVLNPTHIFGGTASASQTLDYLGTVRGRVGYLFTPSFLVYATGGLAYGGGNLSSLLLRDGKRRRRIRRQRLWRRERFEHSSRLDGRRRPGVDVRE